MHITGGKYNSRIIKTPDFDNIKPTLSKTRQAIFNTLSSIINFEDKIFADLFAGSGIMSLEAISRGFNVYTFEKDKKTTSVIKETFNNLGLKANLYFGDSLKNITKIPQKADVIFIDPPYDSNLYDKSLNIIKTNNILTKDGIVILEHPISKVIDYSGFEIIKIKTYSDKQITFLKQLINQAE